MREIEQLSKYLYFDNKNQSYYFAPNNDRLEIFYSSFGNNQSNESNKSLWDEILNTKLRTKKVRIRKS